MHHPTLLFYCLGCFGRGLFYLRTLSQCSVQFLCDFFRLLFKLKFLCLCLQINCSDLFNLHYYVLFIYLENLDMLP